MRFARCILRDNKKEGLLHLKRMSRYDIKNALSDKYMPLSDQTHGPYYMMPPELLHTSGSGLIKYMFESLQNQIGEGRFGIGLISYMYKSICLCKDKVNVTSLVIHLGMV